MRVQRKSVQGYRVMQTVLISVVIIIITLGTAPTNAQGPLFKTGVAVTPRNFPNHSAYDLTNAYHLATDLCPYAVFIFQWSELDLNRKLISVARHK